MAVSRRIAGEVMNECMVTAFKKVFLSQNLKISNYFVLIYHFPCCSLDPCTIICIILEHNRVLHDFFHLIVLACIHVV